MRADRLLSILLLLQVHRRVTARQLAKRLEVSERTILRDMDALSGSGVPVVAERGAGGGWSLLDEYQTRLTGLSEPEIQSLFLARPARLMADLGLRKQSEAALIKLQASLPTASRRRAEFARESILIDHRGWKDPGESISSLPLLLDALWRGQRVQFVYRKTDCEAGQRTVSPLGLVAKGSVWYLVASADSEARTYRLSRISDALILDQPSSRPADFNLALYWEQSAAEFRQQLPRYYATFLVQPAAMRWVRYRGWRLLEETPECDHTRVRIRFDVEEEAVQFALSFGGEVEAIEPSELRAKVLAGARATLLRYVR